MAPHAATWAANLAHGLSGATLGPPPNLLLSLEYYDQLPSQVAQTGLLASPVPSKLGCFLVSGPLLMSLDIYYYLHWAEVIELGGGDLDWATGFDSTDGSRAEHS